MLTTLLPQNKQINNRRCVDRGESRERENRRESRGEHEREGRFQTSVAKKILSEILNEARDPRPVHFKIQGEHTSQLVDDMCIMSLREYTVVIQKFSTTKVMYFNLALIVSFTKWIKYQIVISFSVHVRSECVCDVIHSLVLALVAQDCCQLPVVTDLFTFVDWQEHEISSGCTAAGRPANNTALQVPHCSRYGPHPPLTVLPSLDDL